MHHGRVAPAPIDVTRRSTVAVPSVTTSEHGGSDKRRVTHTTLADLRKVSATRIWPEHPPTPVPTLQEGLARLGRRAFVILDRKTASADVLVRAVEEARLEDRVIIQSTALAWLEEVRRLNPRIALSYLGNSKLTASRIENARRAGISLIHWKDRALPASDVARLKAAGFLVGVYVVNDRDAMVRAAQKGVDFITTDWPDLGLRLREEGALARPEAAPSPAAP